MHAFRNLRPAALILAVSAALMPVPSNAFVVGFASEWTQILNNLELIGISGQGAEQVQNQLTQIGQLAEQIQNQMQIYQNMLQNTEQLSAHVWGDVESDFDRLEAVINDGRGIAFSMRNIDEALKSRFPSFGELREDSGEGGNFASRYDDWSNTNRETIAATMRAAGLTDEQLNSEEATLDQLRSQSQSAVGQMQALQVAHQIATQQVEQTQKLRALVSQQIEMTGTWYQSEQAARDLAQARRDTFFGSGTYRLGGGQKMEPRW